MKALWLRLLLTGGSLKVTRVPFCAAAAEYVITSGPFVEIYAAWVVLFLVEGPAVILEKFYASSWVG